MNLWLANPRGFCAGVERAVKIVEELLKLSDEPVYVRHEIVHNHHVVEGLRALGAVFVDEVAQIPPGALAVVSAHGAPPQVFADAAKQRLRLFDATCPLVSKVHLEVIEHARAGRSVFLIGHRNHVEVLGTLGHYNNPAGGGIQVVQDELEAALVQARDPQAVAYVTQTTLAVDAAERVVAVLRGRFPALRAPHHADICYATQNRQEAVRLLCQHSEKILILGAPHSSNSVRMVEVAIEAGVPAHLIESAAEIDPLWLVGVQNLGLSSSASAPEVLVSKAIARIKLWHPDLQVLVMGQPEEMVFKLPSALISLVEQRGALTAARARSTIGSSSCGPSAVNSSTP